MSSLPSRSSDWEARDAIDWALTNYPGQTALSCSFGGPTGIVALDMAMQRDRSTPVYYLDTGLLFAQTHELVQRVSERYGITPIAVRPSLSLREQEALYGVALWERDPDRCCEIRKLEPQTGFLASFKIWITGLRRDQSAARAATSLVEYDDRFAVVKLNPFARWTSERIWSYIREHDLPYNELNDRGYPSVGCVPCTRAIVAGENIRAGRWDGTQKTECGLHLALAGRHESH